MYRYGATGHCPHPVTVTCGALSQNTCYPRSLNLEGPFEHKFVLDPCFDTLFVASSTFSETRAFRSNRADLAKTYERNLCATRTQVATTWAQIQFPNFKKCTFCVLWARALLNQPSGFFSLDQFVYQLVPRKGPKQWNHQKMALLLYSGTLDY